MKSVRIIFNFSYFDRFAESGGVQGPEQRCLPALPDAARGEEESAGEEQQTHLAVSRQRSTPGPPRHQGEVSRSNQVLLLPQYSNNCDVTKG